MTAPTSHCRVVVDMGKCSGLGMCEAVAPDVFEIADDGSLQVLKTVADISERNLLEEAAAACPTQAIEIRIAR
ncbi:ferredoxin [Nocardia sp. NPDC004860]|uniref:ferredoxin n=1 Tax=Nocardia sp. NPDC004860 TaxID=3154557 RepID=UPI0033B518EF